MGIASFLNGEPPNRLRGAAFLALSDTGQVGAGTFADDGGGGGTLTWAYGSDVACRVDTLTVGDEQPVGDRISDRSTHLLTLPAGTSLTVENRFAIDGRGTFEVTAIRDSSAQPVLFAEVVEVT